MRWFLSKTDRLFSMAEKLAAESRFEESIKYFDEAIRIDSKYPQLYVYRALALSELSLLNEALDSCRTAETIEPSNFVFPMYRAAILLDFGRAQEALHSVQRAIALQPGNTAAAGYEQLAKWDLGGKDAVRRLKEIIRDIPIGVQSRIAIRLDLQPLPQFEQPDEINQPLPVPF